MRARHERRNRYSIRKFSVGVASVLVATFFCAGGGQVVQAADVARPQGVSSGLEVHRKDLQDRLENLTLSEKEKEGYRDQIKNAPDHFKLAELEQLLTQLEDRETQAAVDKANVDLRKYMTIRLDDLDKSGSTFQNLLEELRGVLEEYRGQLEDAPNRKEVEGLVNRAKSEMDAYIAEYEKTLAPAPADAGQDQAGKDQAGAAGQDQAGKDQAGAAGQDQAGKDQAGAAGQDQAGKDQAGAAGQDQAGKDQAGAAGQAGDAGKGNAGNAGQAGDAGKPSPRNQTFTGTTGEVKVTVLFDKPVNAEKVTIKEVTQPDLVERIARQVGGGSIRLFDLSVTRGGKETHVNEGRTVRLALDGLGGDVQVYHVKPNGQLELLNSKVEDGHVIFRINHFSLFAIKTTSKKSGQETPSNQATPGTQAKSTPKETTKDTTSKKTLPNTGTADSTALLAAAASTAILGLGIAGRRHKED